ncbi:MAG: DEAD/DEAH box helicase [Leptospiraceae bacterium]|nr:DEAD/DEAH box helicase [Leptospiraceae bacterium]
MLISTPSEDQKVQVRGRHYVVSKLNPFKTKEGYISNILDLKCLEEDVLEEEENISILWELEAKIGARILGDKALIPEITGFDAPEKFDSFLNAVRWGILSDTFDDNLQAPFRAGIDIEDYQLVPLVKALNMPRANMLIADDVGLGKTIEAGLILHEFILRQKARKILIICPSSLQLKWKEQMREKFGIDFEIADSEYLRQLRRKRGLDVNPWNHFPRLITSIDYIKRDRALQMYRELLPAPGESPYPRRFDMMIVDEAHNVAPSSRLNYSVDSQRTKLIKELVPHFEHKLFLTATPHNGYKESFTALLELIDDQRFARGVEPDKTQLATTMVRRLKNEFADKSTGKKKFPARVLKHLVVNYTPEEKEAHSLLQKYTELRHFAPSVTERIAIEFVLKLLKKRLFSSPSAFGLTLKKHIQSLETTTKKKLIKRDINESILKRKIAELEEEFGNDEQYKTTEEEVVNTTANFFREATNEEKHILEKLQTYAEQWSFRDSKAKVLVEWIRANLFTEKNWNDERVIIFTEYRDTQKWLQEIFGRERFFDEGRTQIIYGGMDPEEREKIKAEFQTHPKDTKVRILLATDAASEGIDLQNYCSRLIHFEIPWNPNRMEQRNGRLDRHGQKANEVQIFHFVGGNFEDGDISSKKAGDLDGDLEFLMRAAKKVNQIREDLGQSGDVITEQIETAMLGFERGNSGVAPTAVQKRERKKLEKIEQNLQKEVEKSYKQLLKTGEELGITPTAIQNTVNDALRLAGKELLIPTNQRGIFQVPRFTGPWSKALEGLKHPFLDSVRSITFDPDLAKGKDDVVYAHLNHRLVRMSLELLRSEIWSSTETKKLNRITIKGIDKSVTSMITAVVFARMIVVGGEKRKVRLLEEIICAGGELVNGKYKKISSEKELQKILEKSYIADVPESKKKDILEFKEIFKEGLNLSIETKKDEKNKSLPQLLEKRKEEDCKRIEEVLLELKRQIESLLNEHKDDSQLSFWTPEETDQFKLDGVELRNRSNRIPAEIESEKINISDKYKNHRIEIFPVGVSFYIPL